MRRIAATILALAVTCAAGGCGSPSRANIQLRKEKQALQERILRLEQEREALKARIAGLESQRPTTAVLPQDKLDALVTAHGLILGKATAGVDLDAATAGDEAVKVYVAATDRDGEIIKAAGTFTIELFDLARPKDHRIGQAEFGADQVRRAWHAMGSFRWYVLTCPFETRPTGEQVTVRATFRDALTDRILTTQTVATVKP